MDEEIKRILSLLKKHIASSIVPLPENVDPLTDREYLRIQAHNERIYRAMEEKAEGKIMTSKEEFASAAATERERSNDLLLSAGNRYTHSAYLAQKVYDTELARIRQIYEDEKNRIDTEWVRFIFGLEYILIKGEA